MSEGAMQGAMQGAARGETPSTVLLSCKACGPQLSLLQHEISKGSEVALRGDQQRLSGLQALSVGGDSGLVLLT